MPAATDWQQLLADLATGLWRLRRRLAAAAGTDPGELRRVQRDIDALADRLAEADVEIIDHTGEPYQPEKSLRVLAFQPTAEIAEETVTETLRPTIYYQGQWIQMAEVIVGTPEPS